jgi:hypothetical protein
MLCTLQRFIPLSSDLVRYSAGTALSLLDEEEEVAVEEGVLEC